MSGLSDLVKAAKQDKTSPEQKTSGPNKKQTRLAKSKDPNYTQAMSYIPKSLHRQVKAQLLQEDYNDMDFSELVTALLQCWLEEQSK